MVTSVPVLILITDNTRQGGDGVVVWGEGEVSSLEADVCVFLGLTG